jgi:hypothetical protein
MSSFREPVEWSYKDIKQMWTIVDFPRKLKVKEAPIALLYICGVLLWNIKVCFGHGGQVSRAFECAAPSLEEYLRAGQ